MCVSLRMAEISLWCIQLVTCWMLSLHFATPSHPHATCRLAKERDLEGIDVSNIVEGGRRARHGVVSGPSVNYAAMDMAGSSSDDEEEAREDSAEIEASGAEDSDEAGSGNEGGPLHGYEYSMLRPAISHKQLRMHCKDSQSQYLCDCNTCSCPFMCLGLSGIMTLHACSETSPQLLFK